MEYDDFEIVIREKENGGYPISAGYLDGYFELPEDIEKLKGEIEEIQILKSY